MAFFEEFFVLFIIRIRITYSSCFHVGGSPYPVNFYNELRRFILITPIFRRLLYSINKMDKVCKISFKHTHPTYPRAIPS